MKRLIFCSIAVAAITTLLLTYGLAFAGSKWIPWPIGEDSLNTDNWEVEPYDSSCYQFAVEDGTLKVIAYPNCDGRRFFARVNDGGEIKQIRADVEIKESYGCWRARLVADPLFVTDVFGLPHPGGPDGKRDGTVFHQLALVNDWCSPPTIARLIAYPDETPWLNLFNATFRTPWSGEWNPDYPPIVGHKYTLTLSVREGHIDSEIKGYGKIKFEVPGLEYIENENFIGLSCFSADWGYGKAVFSNVWVRY